MNKLSRLGLILLVLAAGSPARGGTDEPLTVVASIFPLKEFAQAVAGDRAEVELFLPPGAEIHTWQPSARQMLTLNRARLFIYVGAHLEPWAASAVRSREKAGLMVLEASRGMPLLHGDPHVWLDFERDRVIVDRIRDALITLDPGEADLFRKNAADYAARLEKLDRSYREMIATCRVRTLILGGHAAFGYLAERYGLTQEAVYGLSPDSEPTPRHLLEVARLVSEKKIPAIFFETTVSPKLARLLARETGAEALPLSTGVDITPEQAAGGATFISLMEENLKSLQHGLRCRR
jgi:zinc transport system substrate-binding protein